MLAMDFLIVGTSQAVQTTRVGLDMVLNIRTLPFHKRFVGFGQSLPQQFIHNITADALNSGDNALCRRLRTLAALTDLQTRVSAAEEREFHLANSYAAARDETLALQNERHDRVKSVKNQVRAQFGNDSNEVASLGLKKASERKPPKRQSKPDGNGA